MAQYNRGDAALGVAVIGIMFAFFIHCWLPCVICFGVIGFVVCIINKNVIEERENAMRLHQMAIQQSNSNVNV
ncbi:unnamed protein product [Meloidogyne enterolobii]|uniref:Uncharacterized protein n=1 Tax=Meloidogyne enterolobii TaxID=390850 RepID=A0ACB0ZX31_MELEN